MNTLLMLRPAQREEWCAVLARMAAHDVYHLPEYHALAEARGEGAGRLYAWSEGDHAIALPLLLRPLEGGGAGWQDATSIYGYAGPLSSHPEMPPEIVRRFQEALRAALAGERVVTVFSRLHPLLPQAPILAGLGDCLLNGPTVSIDVSGTVEAQRAAYRRNHRRDLKTLAAQGVTCTREPLAGHLDTFIEIYHATMRRTGATEDYFFDRDYCNALAGAWRGAMELFLCWQRGVIVCAGLYTAHGSIAQAHLAGTADGYTDLAPMKLMYDAAADWARARGCAVLHMGGGVGAREDALFRFKQGFSPRRHEFQTWRWIVDEPMHARLCAERMRANQALGLDPGPAAHFPRYRSAGVPRARPRLYLSPPHLGEAELEFVKEAFATNWIAPLGPHVDAFEKEFASYVGVPHAAALSSGTAAIHLALRLLGMQPGDEVICSTLTFSASANPIAYEGGHPVFIDSEPRSWNMDPTLLAEELAACAARGKLPRAVIVVDLYGQCADYDPIVETCARYDVPIIQDSAEALGASYRGRRAGAQGRLGVFSFNGNKIITTSGGGMLVSEDAQLIERARFLATQARDPAPHYQHSQIGFNYRLSNVLAGIGRGQLQALPSRVAARRQNFQRYKNALGALPGVEFMPIADHGEPNGWLTCLTIDPALFGATREDVRLALEAENIEARPVWKPLHLQPVFSHCRTRGGAFAASLFARGLCLPSGSSLGEDEHARVCHLVSETPRQSLPPP